MFENSIFLKRSQHCCINIGFYNRYFHTLSNLICKLVINAYLNGDSQFAESRFARIAVWTIRRKKKLENVNIFFF